MKRHASLNRIYRLVWSRVKNAWIAVSENAKGKGKSGRSAIMKRSAVAAALSMAFAPLAQASPTGGLVVSGAGSIAQAGLVTTINQSSQTLSLNWQSFNIAASETVNFVQPSASAIAVNRILDPNGSQILGHLSANGEIFLINPNGILFGQGAQVNVGGLVASTLDVSDAALSGNTLSFSGNGTGSVINQGTINAGNYVALLGNHVGNTGTITAQLGTVALGAGSAATLTFNGNSLLHLQVDSSTLNNLAENGGLIQADGGQVLMSAGAKDALLASVVNNTGVIEARTVESHAGTITLLGGMQAGTVNVGGTLDASAPDGGNGGSIETSAHQVNVASNATLTTAATLGLSGSWLIDPYDFKIAATGGDITGAALSAALGSNNVTIQTLATSVSCTGATCGLGTSSGSGNINVNDTVTWSAHQLTLSAYNNININTSMNGSGTASLALQYGQGALAAGNTGNYFLNNGAQINLSAGQNFSTKLGSDGTTVNYTVITPTVAGLQSMSNNLAGNYALGASFDAQLTSVAPIGDDSDGTTATQFTGSFDGLGHTISNLVVSSTANYVGMFGYVATVSSVPNSGLIRNIGLVGGSVTGGSYYVGGLVGANFGTISNSYTTGNVSGGSYNWIGGLVGVNYGTIINSHASGSVSGANYVGGLVGANFGTISNSFASGDVVGGKGVGGLVGINYGTGTINTGSATGSVSGSSDDIGGLVGRNYGTITGSTASGNVSGGLYASINVTGSSAVGGLVGINYGTISASSATGSVTGVSAVGGLVGSNGNGIQNLLVGTTNNTSFASGSVTGVSNVGGLVGANYGTISSSYASGNVSSISGPVPNRFLGGLVGYNYGSGTITNSSASGSVTSTDNGLGGLVGANYGTIMNSYATGNVTGASYVGGLVGTNGSSLSPVGTISNSYVTQGNSGSTYVSGSSYVGGLVGRNYGTISNSYSTVSVSGKSVVGGLVGTNYGTVSSSYATGKVSGNTNVGGLVGINYGTANNIGTVNDSYATGNVTGASFVGGLAGYNNGGGINNTYATGSVTGVGSVSGSNYVGGLAGANNTGTINNSFYNNTVNPALTGIGGLTVGTPDAAGTVAGLSTANMMLVSNFTSATSANGNVNPGWDFTTPVWRINPTVNNGYPCLAWAPACVPFATTTLYLDPVPGSSIYGNTPTFTYVLDTSPTYGSGSMVSNATAQPSGTAIWSGAPTSASSVGSYSLAYVSGITLNNSAYTLSAGNAANWSVTARPVTLTGSMTYNGTTSISGTLLSATNLVNNDSVTVGGTGTLSSKNAGSEGIATLTNLTLNNSNYTIVGGSGTVTVNAAQLAVTAAAESMTYGGASLPTLAYTYGALAGGDTASVFSGSLATAATAYNGTAGSASNVGTYAITQGSLSAGGNYTISYTGANLTVNKATLNVTANALSMTYGGATLPTLTYSESGLVNGDTASIFTGSLATAATAYNGTAGSGSNVGSYAITQGSLAVSGNYTIGNYTAANLVVTPVSLTVTANSAYRTFGSANPIFGVSYRGFANGDTSSSLTTQATASSAASPASSAGSYAVTASGAADANYNIGYVAGTLTVVPLVLTGDTFIFPTGPSTPSSPPSVSGPAGSGSSMNQAAARQAEVAVLTPIVPAASAPSGWGGITVVDGGVLMPANAFAP